MSFPTPRPRGKDAPAKAPRRQTPGLAVTVKKAMAKPRKWLANITLENREVGRANTERRRAIAKGGI